MTPENSFSPDRRTVLRAATWAVPAVTLAAASPAFAASDDTVFIDLALAGWDNSVSVIPQATFFWSVTNSSADVDTPVQMLVRLPMGEATSVTLHPYEPDVWSWDGWELIGSATSAPGDPASPTGTDALFTFGIAAAPPGYSQTLQIAAEFVGNPRTSVDGVVQPYMITLEIVPGSVRAGHTIGGSPSVTIHVAEL